MAVSNLDKYVRGQQPSLPESKAKYLEQEFQKLERQAATSFDKLVLTESTVEGLQAEITIERDARIEQDEALAQQIETIVAVGARQNVFRQDTQPASGVAGDLWIESDAGNALYYYNGTAWVAADNAAIAANAAAITSEATARSSADSSLASQIATVSATASRQRVSRQGSAPSTPVTGDLWIDTSDNNKLKYWSGTAWALSDDLRIAVNEAAITTETTARADADSALATQITTLSSSTSTGLSNLSAQIATESTARTNADTALSAQIATVSATAAAKNRTYRQDSAPTGAVTGDVWYDSDDSNKPYRWDGTAWVATEDTRIASNAAAITTEATARASADSALASQITSLSSSVSDVAASVTAEATARASQDTALASQITSLSSTVAGNTSAISAEATTRANADSALSTQISTVSATASSASTAASTAQASANAAQTSANNAQTSANAAAAAAAAAQTTANNKNKTFLQSSAPTATAVGDIWINTSDNNKLYRWDGSSWALADDARIALNTAAITTEATARASGDTALASQITSLSSTVSGQTTTLSTLQSSLDGVEGRYGVTINNNGHISGISLLSDSSNGNPSSVFRIAAEQFAIRTPGASTDSVYWNSGTSKLIVRGDIEATSVTTGSVDTLGIVQNAVTAPAAANNPNTVFCYPTGPAEVEVLSVSLDSGGAPVFVIFSLTAIVTTNDPYKYGATLQMYNNGAYMGPQSLAFSTASGGGTTWDTAAYNVTRAFYVPTPGTGVRTFSLRLIRNPYNEGRCSQASLFVLGVKR